MNVLYQFNDKYAPYAGISITSLFENNISEDITVWVLGEEIQEDNKAKLLKTAENYRQKIIFIDDDQINRLINKMRKWDMPTYRGSYAANMRLFLPEVLPDSVARVLYLDADTIVQGNIASLYEMNFDGKAIAMVQDSLGERHKSDLGFSKVDKYYNSGVILFDMNVWKKLRLTERIIDHIKNERAQYPSPDQDLINVVCHRYIKCIGAEYNFQPIHSAYTDIQYFRYYGKTAYYSEEDISIARNNIIILHCFRFIGEFPWDADNVHPFSEIFDEFSKLSLWCDYVKKNANNGLLMKVEKILYKILPRGTFLFIFSLSHNLFYKRANEMSVRKRISRIM